MKSIFQPFYPDKTCRSSYDIDYEKLYASGCRGLIYDIDNTLVEHGAPANEKAVGLFERLHSIGFKTCLISNNSEERVKPFAEAVDSFYIWKAGKPKGAGYIRCCEVMGLEKSQVLFIGDQLFTDIWGANRAGIHNILVEKIGPKEEIQIILKRRLEAIVLFFYKRRKKA